MKLSKLSYIILFYLPFIYFGIYAVLSGFIASYLFCATRPSESEILFLKTIELSINGPVIEDI